MEILPDIWKYHIISYLPEWDKYRMRLVNKWFKSLVESVWEPGIDYVNLPMVTIEPNNLLLQSKYSEFDLSRLTSLKGLLFMCSENSLSEAEKFLLSLSSRLETLFLSHFNESPPLTLPSTLQRLVLYNCPQLTIQHLNHLPPSLRVLDLGCNIFTDDELQKIVSPLTNLVKLSIDIGDLNTERGLTHLPVTLQSFQLSNHYILTDRLHLTHLGILGDDQLTTIQNTVIQSLQVGFCQNLKTIPTQITHLDIINCPLLTDLSALSVLQHLDLTVTRITKYPMSLTSLSLLIDRDEDLIALQSLTNLRMLNFSVCKNVSFDFFKHLPTTLTTLKFNWNNGFAWGQNLTVTNFQYLPSTIRFLNLEQADLEPSAWEYLKSKDIVLSWKGNEYGSV